MASRIPVIAPLPAYKPLAPFPVLPELGVEITPGGYPKTLEKTLYQDSISPFSTASSSISIDTEMQDVISDHYAMADVYLQDSPEDFQVFIQWVNLVVQVYHLARSGDYSVDEIRDYDINDHLEDDIEFDAQTGVELFFELQVSSQVISDEEISGLLSRYAGNYVELFQQLFSDYISPDYRMDGNVKEDFSNLDIY